VLRDAPFGHSSAWGLSLMALRNIPHPEEPP
jgi:hypothetical protein